MAKPDAAAQRETERQQAKQAIVFFMGAATKALNPSQSAEFCLKSAKEFVDAAEKEGVFPAEFFA